MKKNQALINYYARLIRKDQYKESDVPDNLREDVMAKVSELPPIMFDPDTKAPSWK